MTTALTFFVHLNGVLCLLATGMVVIGVARGKTLQRGDRVWEMVATLVAVTMFVYAVLYAYWMISTLIGGTE